MTTGIIRLFVLLALALVASAAAPVPAPPLSPIDLFDSPAPLRVVDDPQPIAVFDQAALPEDYETCYRENAYRTHLKITLPYDGASYPFNIAPPEVRWEDTVDNLWLVTLSVPGWPEPLKAVVDRRAWRPDAALWSRITADAKDKSVSLEVRGIKRENGVSAGDVYADSVSFRVSSWPVDPVIVYRLVTPLFHAFKTPDIWWRSVSTFDKGLFYPGWGTFCTNCHSFPGSPDLEARDLNLAIAVRDQLGEKKYRILGLYNFATQSGRTMEINSFFMSWDPRGTKMIVCAGAEIYSKPLVTLEAQEFFVRQANILLIDAQKLESKPLPGASTTEYMETFPAWSPDGKTIIFARAEEMGDEWHETKFNLYRLPFNDGNGGTPEPVAGAAENGVSSFFPRFSPDGKWLCFNQADWSSLVAPTADLFIMSTEPGAHPRKLECNVDYAMDSHHCWSSNSRWLLFATKRDDGVFATVWLSEIDENGHASPPVQIPTDEETMMCYNVPEFMKYAMPIDGTDIVRETGYVD